MLELRNSESQLQAAIESAATETTRGVGRRAAERWRSRVEYRGSLVERSKLSAYVLESHRQGGLDGAESELRAAVFGDRGAAWTRALGGAFAAGLERQSHSNQRVDANTNVTSNAGGTQETILGRIFADSAAASFSGRSDGVCRIVGVSPPIL